MNQQSRKSLEDHLIERIKESGYPLEIEVSNSLDPDYIVFNSSYYFDEEAKKDRDIDIYAIPYENANVFLDDELKKRMEPFYLQTEIAIECKKSTTHCWVFFFRPFLKPCNLHISGQYVDKFSNTSIPSAVEALLFDKLCNDEKKKLHYESFEEVAVAYAEIRKEGNEKSRNDIFEGLTQLAKFLNYEIGEPKEPDISKPDFSIAMYFPIIVFDGDMYKVNLKSGEPKVEKTNHVIIRKNYSSPYTKRVNRFLIDIVHRTYFAEYLKLLAANFRNMRETILENHEDFVKDAKLTMQTYQEYRSLHFNQP